MIDDSNHYCIGSRIHRNTLGLLTRRRDRSKSGWISAPRATAAPVETGREAAGEASPRRGTWPCPVAAVPRRRRGDGPRNQKLPRRNGSAKESEEKSGERRKWKAGELGARGGRERPSASGQTKWPSRFFGSGFCGVSGWPRLPFQVISARRGGAAADAVVGAGEPIGRQSPLGVGVARGVRCPRREAGSGVG